MGATVVTVTSGKGGVGKTTVTANLSIALAMLGQRVIAVDTDIGLRNLDVVMGLENRIVYNLVDVIEGRCRVQQALVRDRKINHLCMVCSEGCRLTGSCRIGDHPQENKHKDQLKTKPPLAGDHHSTSLK